MSRKDSLLRAEIEENVKTRGIDRKRFYEYSKQRYEEILEWFYNTFFDLPRRQLDFEFYPWAHIRKKWKQTGSTGLLQQGSDWADYLKKMRALLPCSDEQKLLLITSDDFVYEGYPQEIFAVLSEASYLLKDFYLVSPKFDWMAVFCDDADCANLYRQL